MKHKIHILVLIVFNLLLLIPNSAFGDESTSFQNDGSSIENATPSELQSDNYSMQDTGTTWRPSASESDSFETGGDSESESESDGDSTEISGSGGGDDGESGGRRARETAAAPVTDPASPPPADDDATVADTPQSRPRAPVGSVVTDDSPGTSGPHAAVEKENAGTDGQQASGGVHDRPDARGETHGAAPGEPAQSPLRTVIRTITSSVTGPAFSEAKLASVTAVDASVLARLGYVYRASSLYEAIPAYASSESITGAAGFMMRPGSIQLSALVPFFGFRKKKKNTKSV